MNLEKLADKLEDEVLADPSVASAIAKLYMNDSEEPAPVPNPPVLPNPDVFPLTCETKNCCMKLGETKVFELAGFESVIFEERDIFSH